MISCWHGLIGSFLADADDSELMTTVHFVILMGIALHAYGMEWRPALKLRDQLVRAAKASETHVARLPVNGGEASLIISVVGVPSFEIHAKK